MYYLRLKSNFKKDLKMEIELFVGFLSFFFTAIVLVIVFLYLYAIVTPYDDYKLIFQENNLAAALGFGGAIIGVSIPLYSVLVHSVSYMDFAIWGAIAIAIQLIFALIVTRLSGKYSFEKEISNGAIPVGTLMAFLSISIGLLNAGSMSY
jgi:putative membrane protein